MLGTHTVTHFVRYADGIAETKTRQTAREAEVVLSVNGKAWLGFRCTPENLEALAAGFLFNESFIESANEIASIYLCDQRDHLDVWLNHAASKPDTWSRTSGCQGGSAQAGTVSIQPVSTATRYHISDILALVDRFYTELVMPDQPQHGLHTSMLVDRQEVVTISSDIGRHNTLDKIAGETMMKPYQLSEPALITTGRISSEMVYKAARMKIPLAISLHSISNLAIEAGNRMGVTLVGHARRSQVDIYSQPESIVMV